MEGVYIDNYKCLQIVVGVTLKDEKFIEWDIYGISRVQEDRFVSWIGTATDFDSKNSVSVEISDPFKKRSEVSIFDDHILWHEDNTKWQRVAFSPWQLWIIQKYAMKNKTPFTIFFLRTVVEALFIACKSLMTRLCKVLPLFSICNMVEVSV